MVYAHEPEVRELKKIIKNNGLDKSVGFLQLHSHTRYVNNFTYLVCDKIINVGFAGALKAGFTVGDVVLVKKIVNIRNGDKLKPSSSFQALAEKFSTENKIKQISLLTSDKPVTNEKFRDKLARESNADIVDMEAFYLFELAKKTNVPFVSFKIVSDMSDNGTWNNIKTNKKELSSKLAKTVFEFLKLSGEIDENIGNHSRL